MKKTLLAIATVSLLCGCQRGCNSLERNVIFSDRNYHIEQYSGGVKIKEFNFKGILNNQQHSDGFYFFKDGKLIEVSGDIYIESY